MSEILEPKKSILVVGAGPVGHALARGLLAAGYPLRHWSRSRGALWAENQRPQAAEVVILAVRDDVIAQAARFVLEHGAADSGSVLIHCAGALPPEEAFAAQAAWVRGVGLLHPLRSLSTSEVGADLMGTVMAVCGDPVGRDVAFELALSLGGVPLTLPVEKLGAYHAAAVLCAGHVAALIDAAVSVLMGIGLERRPAERALASLTRSLCENVDALGLPAAMTGPFARGDAATIARHLEALPALSAEATRAYRALAPLCISLARAKGATDEDALARIAALLCP